jgi:hypothetical protein
MWPRRASLAAADAIVVKYPVRGAAPSEKPALAGEETRAKDPAERQETGCPAYARQPVIRGCA